MLHLALYTIKVRFECEFHYFRLKHPSSFSKSSRGSSALSVAELSSIAVSPTTSQAEYGQLVSFGPVVDRTPPNFRVLLNPPERASSVVSAIVLHNIYMQHGIPKEDVRPTKKR